MKLPNWLVYTLVCIITGVWVANFAVAVFNPNYKPPEEINLIFSTVVGALLLNIRRKGDDE